MVRMKTFYYKYRKNKDNFHNVSPEGFIRWGRASLPDEAFGRNVVEIVFVLPVLMSAGWVKMGPSPHRTVLRHERSKIA